MEKSGSMEKNRPCFTVGGFSEVVQWVQVLFLLICIDKCTSTSALPPHQYRQIHVYKCSFSSSLLFLFQTVSTHACRQNTHTIRSYAPSCSCTAYDGYNEPYYSTLLYPDIKSSCWSNKWLFFRRSWSTWWLRLRINQYLTGSYLALIISLEIQNPEIWLQMKRFIIPVDYCTLQLLLSYTSKACVPFPTL